MTKITIPALAAALALALGCSKGSTDTSRVLANVGGEKITEAEFRAITESMAKDPAQAKDFMESSASPIRDQRIGAVHQMAFQKAVIAMAKAENLDADPAVRNLVESAQAQAYLQVLADRRSSHQALDAMVEPAYAFLVNQLKAEGRAAQGLPTLAEVKANPNLANQVVAAWRQRSLQDEIKAKFPATYADDYQQ